MDPNHEVAQSLLPPHDASGSLLPAAAAAASSSSSLVNGLENLRNSVNQQQSSSYAVAPDIKPTINYAKQVVHHHHYSEEKQRKKIKQETDEEESGVSNKEEAVHVHIDAVSEREMYPAGETYKRGCFHCHKAVKRQYPPHPEAIGTYYIVCANACGRLVLHRECANKIALDPKAEKFHRCDKCQGEFTVSPTLAILQSLYDTGRRIPFRKLLRYGLHLFLLSYLLKFWWFLTIVVGYEPIDRVHNPALIKAKSVGFFDIFVYNFTVMDRVSHTWIGQVGRSIGAEFDPVAYRSYGLKPDAGQLWLTVRFLTFVAVMYFFINLLVMMLGWKVRGFFTYAEIKTKTGLVSPAKGAKSTPRTHGKKVPRNRAH